MAKTQAKKTRKPGQGGWGGPGPEPGSMPRPKVPYRGTGSAVGTAPKPISPKPKPGPTSGTRRGPISGTPPVTGRGRDVILNPLPPGVKETHIVDYPRGHPKGKTVTKTAKARKR